MPGVSLKENFAPEHQIFWMLVKKSQKRDDVSRVYLAIQAAIAYGQETVDVDWLSGAMMAEGQPIAAAVGNGIGADGLAYFYWLYAVELVTAGDSDCHHYRFHRRYDGTQIIALLRTAPAPRSLQFQQQYERERRRLESKRERFRANYHWLTTAELFARYDYNDHSQPPPP